MIDPGCMSELFEVRSVYPASPFCSLTGVFCNTAGSSGSDIDFFDFQRPDLNFASFSTFWNPNAGQVDLSYQGIVSASSGQINAGTSTTIGFYCDQDGSQDLSTGDSLLHTYTTTQAISATSPHFFSGLFSFPDSACPATSGILAVIFPDTSVSYCICDTVEAIGASLLDAEHLTLSGNRRDFGNYLAWKGIEGTGEYELQRWENDWIPLNSQRAAEGENMSFIDLTPASRQIYRVVLRRPSGLSVQSNLLELIRGEDIVPSVVPNPFSETLGLRNAAGYSFQIRNVVGQVVLSGSIESSSHQIGTERLPTGSYILYLQNGQASSIHKLIRQ